MGVNLVRSIRVAILDDHQGIIDGYRFRLKDTSDIQYVGAAMYGEDLEPLLVENPVDVLLLDVQVPTSLQNPNPYPILHVIPKLLQMYPHLAVLAISMHTQRTLINAVMDAGASGYILKDDQSAIRDLGSIIRTVAEGGVYLSQYAYQQLLKRHTGELRQLLSQREIEVLSLCASYPNDDTSDLAKRMNVANSTVRNLLSHAYIKLNVRSRTAAIAQARKMGLLAPDISLPRV